MSRVPLYVVRIDSWSIRSVVAGRVCDPSCKVGRLQVISTSPADQSTETVSCVPLFDSVCAELTWPKPSFTPSILDGYISS